MDYSITEYVLLVFFYGVAGWIVECLYCLYINKKWTNRGFVFGPICPIYGFGALTMLLSLSWCREWFWVLIPLGMVVCDGLEYLTSFFTEKLFHIRLWDYSERKCNLNGRICLRHTIFWGLASAGFLYVVDPFVGQKLILWLRGLENGVKIEKTIMAAALFLFAIDYAFAVANAIRIKRIIRRMKPSSDISKKYAAALSKGSPRKFMSLFLNESPQMPGEFDRKREIDDQTQTEGVLSGAGSGNVSDGGQ